MAEELALPFLKMPLTAHSMHAMLVGSSPCNACWLAAGLGQVDGRANA